MGHKICEQRVRGEGMPIRGGGSQGQERGDLIVELLVGNRLQAALMSSGLVPLLLVSPVVASCAFAPRTPHAAL